MKKKLKSILPRIYLHVDGLVMLATGAFLYGYLGFNWWIFVLLLFAPDVFMIGYLRGAAWGAHIYNIGHSLVWVIVLEALGVLLSVDLLLSLGLIWLTHIGLDRLLGFGFKYTDSFKHTLFTEV